MARRPQLRLCMEGMYYICVMAAIMTGAVAKQLNLLMLLGTVLLGPLAFALAYGWVMLKRVEVVRRLPPRFGAGQPLAVRIQVANSHRRLALWALEVEDTLERQDDSQARERSRVGVFFPRVTAGQTARAAYRGRLERRGRYRFGPLRVSTRFPLGLVRHARVVDAFDEVLVHPQIGRLQFEWPDDLRSTLGDSQRVARHANIEADFYGLRDWRSGDSRRLIHWRTSARRGSLVVRQFDEHRSQDIALMLDLWQPADPSEEQLAGVERAVSLTATLLESACRHRGRKLVVDIVGCQRVHSFGPASSAFFGKVMDALAVAAPQDEPDGAAVLARLLARVPLGMKVMVVSTRPIDCEALGKRTRFDGPLARRGLHVFNAADPELIARFHV